MPLEWPALRDQLAAELRTRAARREYTALRRHHPANLLLDTAEDTVAALLDPATSVADKNAACRALIAAARSGCRVATTTLMLGLWPALTALYRRCASSQRDAERFASLIAISFAESIARIDLRRSRQPLATLVLNTRRRIDARKRRGNIDRPELPPLLNVAAGGCRADRARLEAAVMPPALSPLGLPSPLSACEAVWLLRVWLVDLIGIDADLILAVVVEGHSHVELARLIGLRPGTVRSRTHRAISKLRRLAAKQRLQRFSDRSAFPWPSDMPIPLLPAVPCPNHDAGERVPVATIRVGNRFYCIDCAARFQPANSPARAGAMQPHLFGTACWRTGDLTPAAICPRCLHDAFFGEEP